ncbi:hypothetical protein [Streptomyces sp. NPDC001815]|uniref:hypothetical protein n=1 Tax=Streptomyces sp. NPDC001815 TaxID=3154526 RepID=UPI0033332F33
MAAGSDPLARGDEHQLRTSESRVNWAMTTVILRRPAGATEASAHRMRGDQLALGAVGLSMV